MMIVAQAQINSLIWDKPQTVKRLGKKGHTMRPGRKPVESKPLLGVKLRLFMIGTDGAQVETNYRTPFHAGDRLRLGVTANQEGYLYIVHQSAPGADAAVLFPDSRVDYGRNFVEKNQELIVPSICSAGIRAQEDCAYSVPGSAGQEYFTIIFSRDNLGLPVAGQIINNEQLKELIKQSGQRLAEPRLSGSNNRYTVMVVNTNSQDNEELIKTFSLAKAGA